MKRTFNLKLWQGSQEVFNVILRIPVCCMTFDASCVSYFVYLGPICEGCAEQAWWKSDISIGWMGATRMLESISQVFWERCLWGHQIWHARLRWLHPPSSNKDGEEAAHCTGLQPSNTWQLSLSSLLFLLHPRTQAHKYTMGTVTIPHRRKHQCARSLRQSLPEVKLFHLSWVLLSSYKASVRTAGRLIVTY